MNFQKMLLLDIGNTRIKWGIFDNHNIHINGAVNVREAQQDNFLSLYQGNIYEIYNDSGTCRFYIFYC